jgi:3-deoxy-D-manno-octulosonic-acid transferase
MWLYRCLVTLFAAIMAVKTLRNEGWATLRARLSAGRPGQRAPGIWVHAASNGELASIKPVITALAAQDPGRHWLITANTATGVAMARDWALPNAVARLAPLDLAWITRRVLARWQIRAHICAEAEIWPHRILQTQGPVILLGARMSAGTARSWGKLGALGLRVMGRIVLALPQDPGSAERLLRLGLPREALGPVVDLKGLYTPPDQHPDTALRDAFPRAQTWLAASTHEGDEAAVFDAHITARMAEPDLRLILAPRHPRRAPEIMALAAERGLTLAQRSKGDTPEGCDVYLADTMGEMALWYALAGRVFVGGTWSDRGGHTPYEPASFGAALIHGPDTANFRAAFEVLQQAGAAHLVEDAKALAQALNTLAEPGAQAQAGASAVQVLAQDIDLEALVARISNHLVPR